MSHGCALLMEQGTGKSLVTVAIFGRGFLNGEYKKALISCPLSVISAWSHPSFGEFPKIIKKEKVDAKNKKN